MNKDNFLDNFIADRLYLQLEDKNPIHVYEVLSVISTHSLEELKSMYKISLQLVRKIITIQGLPKDICELIDLLCDKLEFNYVTETSLEINLTDFYFKVY